MHGLAVHQSEATSATPGSESQALAASAESAGTSEMQPEAGTSRRTARDTAPGEWGLEVPKKQIGALRVAVRTALAYAGYDSREYVPLVDKTPGRLSLRPKAEAFFKGDEALRKEPFLIDEGGRVCEGRLVTTFVVRQPHPLAIEVNGLLLTAMRLAGLHAMRAQRQDSAIKDKARPDDVLNLVYRLRALPDPRFGEGLARSLIELLAPKPRRVLQPFTLGALRRPLHTEHEPQPDLITHWMVRAREGGRLSF